LVAGIPPGVIRGLVAENYGAAIPIRSPSSRACSSEKFAGSAIKQVPRKAPAPGVQPPREQKLEQRNGIAPARGFGHMGDRHRWQ
jgi:hypothetical protein